MDLNDFFSSFQTYVQHQSSLMDEQRRQNELTQTALLQFIQNSQQSEDFVSAPPRNRTDTEFLIDALSSSIKEFSYDPESNSTFENWYRRYADLTHGILTTKQRFDYF